MVFWTECVYENKDEFYFSFVIWQYVQVYEMLNELPLRKQRGAGSCFNVKIVCMSNTEGFFSSSF